MDANLILDKLKTKIWIKDNQNRIVYINEQGARFLGGKKEDFVDKKVENLFPEMAKKYWSDDLEVIETGQEKLDFIQKYTPLDQKPIWSRTNKIPFEYKGNDSCVLVYSEDITNILSNEILLEELENVNQKVESFSYVASHDLREPLRTIRGMIDLLKKRIQDKLDDKSEDYFNYIDQAAIRLDNLVSDMLEYAKIDKDSDRKELIDLNEIVYEDIYISLKSLIDERQAIIKIHELPKIMVNKIDITRVFQNLISNAIKYSGDSKAPIIEAGYEENDKEYIFYVKDEGIGIKEEYKSKIFKPFTKLHSYTEIQGSGIGLTLCHKILQKYKGEIWVESSYGVGSTFFFNIPKKVKA
jgi:PAS domain S-box-containing protein